jgi:hypothetical protein
MPVWDRIGRAAWAGAKGGRKLRDAAEAAEAAGAGAGGAVEVDPVDTQLTAEEGVLMVRYMMAITVLTWVESVFLVKYAVLVIAVLVAVITQWWWLVALLGVVFLGLALLQRLVSNRVRRFGLLRELSELEPLGEQAVVAWWPNLRGELRRVDLPPTPWGLTKIGAGAVARRLPEGEADKFRAIDWSAVAPRNQWRQARRALADVAASRRT